MLIVLLAYLGGVLTIVSPCILPVLPLCLLGPAAVSCAARCRC
jgi:cytochrome c biogenesis protein CcdA